ncbi:MAG: hypothetical protein OD816_000303 [Thermodesulfobacterium sp.]|uniref:DUF6602 domain-containing protein n=1 Tax=Candidatus Thermodesulfobacterium syntrophicum TaxID=3060442 RepID=A0AAE3P4D3_9BACT|nr:hypothetical protein [Candidatus Thermodesulfobacterium syntrophicum]
MSCSERIGTQGWKQFLAAKQEMLYQYDLAKIYTEAHSVKVAHGKVAEAIFRKWLSEFLPKRFGVTSGRIISPAFKDDKKAPHYDVIIYDQLCSPVLWIEEIPDFSAQGKIRALPVEYVYAVIEVKANLTPKTASDAVKKLEELQPLLQKVDKLEERYKKYFPPNFCSAIVFFELKKDFEFNPKIFNNLIPEKLPRGYIGGLILKGEGLDINNTGRFHVLESKTPIQTTVGRDKESLLKGSPLSDSFKRKEEEYICLFLNWSPANFSMFAFDLIAILNGTFKPGYISSYYGLSYLNPERNKR